MDSLFLSFLLFGAILYYVMISRNDLFYNIDGSYTRFEHCPQFTNLQVFCVILAVGIYFMDLQ